MSDILIIRSVPFQQIDYALPHILSRFPSRRIHLLSHEHGKETALNYSEIEKVKIYPHKGSFSFWRYRTGVEDCKYEAIIVPVSNESGAGFKNVFLFSLRVSATSRFVCNLSAEFKPVTKTSIIRIFIRNIFFTMFAALFGLILSLLMIFFVSIAAIVSRKPRL